LYGSASFYFINLQKPIKVSIKKDKPEASAQIDQKILDEYRQHLIKVTEGNTDRFEKQLSYISAGSLGLTMAFIKDVVGNLDNTKFNWLVMVGWSAMGFTLLLNLFSQIYANHCLSNTIEEIECNNYNSNRAGRRRSRVMWLNYISIVTLIGGVIFLLIFISKNIA
jgi:hypothetical protein